MSTHFQLLPVNALQFDGTEASARAIQEFFGFGEYFFHPAGLEGSFGSLEHLRTGYRHPAGVWVVRPSGMPVGVSSHVVTAHAFKVGYRPTEV